MALVLGDFLESLPQDKKSILVKFSFDYDLSSEERLDDEPSFGLIITCALRLIHQHKGTGNSKQIGHIKESIDYITNELLENSIKYGDRLLPTIVIKIYVTKNKIFIMSTNLTSRARATVFKEHVQRLISSDISDMYLQQIEDNAFTTDKSGLGFLSIIKDYGAQIGWKFEPYKNTEKVVSSVMVQLST